MNRLIYGTRLRFKAGTFAALAALALGSCGDDPEPGDGGGDAGESGEGGSSLGGSANGGSVPSGGSAGDGNTTSGGTTSGGATSGGASGQAGTDDGSGGSAGSAGEAGAGGDGSSGPCVPTAVPGAQGCSVGTRCAWTRHSTTTGELACVPAGTGRLDEACSFGNTAPSGATYDDCEAGLACDETACRKICGFDGSADEDCSSGQACVRVENLFADQGVRPSIGACYETCDPLTQTRIVNGNSTTCGVDRGCYVSQTRAEETIAICASAGTVGHNQPLTGTVYANSCAPGHYGRQVQINGPTFECAAYCKAADVYAGMNDGVSGRPSYEGGDSRSPNWLNRPATCESVAGVTARPEVPDTGESCRYSGIFEGHDYVTRFSNALGVCTPHARWRYDPTGGNNLTTPWPRCPTLTTGDVVTPPNARSDALDWGCQAKPEPATLLLAGTTDENSSGYGVHLDRIDPTP